MKNADRHNLHDTARCGQTFTSCKGRIKTKRSTMTGISPRPFPRSSELFYLGMKQLAKVVAHQTCTGEVPVKISLTVLTDVYLGFSQSLRMAAYLSFSTSLNVRISYHSTLNNLCSWYIVVKEPPLRCE
jgi:hypothetical protein